MSHELERFIVCVQLTSVMAAMGAKLSPRDFTAVFARPKSLVWGLACQFVVAPLLALGAVWIGIPHPGMAMGLLLVCAMPGGPMSTLFTHLGRGNAALAVSITAVSTLLSVVTLPLTLPLLTEASEWIFAKHHAADEATKDFHLPVSVILIETTLFLFLPLAFGFLIQRFSPKTAAFVGRWGVRLGGLLLTTYVVLSLTSGRIKPGAFGFTPAATIVIHTIVCLQLAMLPFRIFKWPPKDRLAVGIEMCVRDVNLALLFKTDLDKNPVVDGRGDPMLYGILFYAGTALVMAFAAMAIFRFWLDPERETRRAKRAEKIRQAQPDSTAG
jgi:bile acid:Na+ symporter, BASS family